MRRGTAFESHTPAQNGGETPRDNRSRLTFEPLDPQLSPEVADRNERSTPDSRAARKGIGDQAPSRPPRREPADRFPSDPGPCRFRADIRHTLRENAESGGAL